MQKKIEQNADKLSAQNTKTQATKRTFYWSALSSTTKQRTYTKGHKNPPLKEEIKSKAQNHKTNTKQRN